MTDAEHSPQPHVEQRASASGTAEVTQAGRDVHQATHVYEAPAPARPSVTRGLRRDFPHFTGRETELTSLLHAAGSDHVRIRTVDGMPGVGKTALVTRAAHLLGKQFPDGQFFVDLRAHAPGQSAADPHDVLANLLAGLGIDPRSLPATLEGRSGLWRDRLATRRVLLVLDDAANSDQIEPLLPGGADCLTLVTSRRRLVDFDGGEPLPLNTLPHAEAVALFSLLAHHAPPHPAPDPSAVVNQLVRLCGHLPLAIVLLAGRLAHRPTWTVADLAADFADATGRLGHLVAGTRAVDAAFRLSYQNLPPGSRQLFRRLSLHPGPDIDSRAAAALSGVPHEQAAEELEALYTDHLLEEVAPRRYRLHDLLREFASKLCTDHEPAVERELALERLLTYYRRMIASAEEVIAAHRRGTPVLPNAHRALTWLRTERANILACLDHAGSHDLPAHVVELDAALAPHLLREGPWPQATALHQRAARTAHQSGDLSGEARALNRIGLVRYMTADYAVSSDFHERALSLFEGLADRHGQADTLNHLGRVRATTDDYEAATDFHERALALFERLADQHGQATALHGLARVRYMTAHYTASTDFNQRALTLFSALGDLRGQSNVLLGLGFVHYLTGNCTEAADLHERALATFEELGDRHGQASALQDLGRVRFITGDYPAAADLHERALSLFEELGDRHGQANGLNNVGRVRYVTGNYAAAADLHERALALFEELGDRHGQANGLIHLGRQRYATGDFAGAAALHGQALALCEEIGNRHGKANALHELGRALYATAERAEARALYEQALQLFQAVADPQGEAEVWNSLGTLRTDTATPQDGIAAHQKALALARHAHSPIDEATALEGSARSRMLAGDFEGCMADLRLAVRIYDRIGAAAVKSPGNVSR
ncbi:ATP-binding protein [Streptomyces sp. NPDC059897]|uniref:ATP-binding protein n=1 Tax=Streptomyces sp. NPDC059897 TaxID=3346994 RepID=UPI00365D1769